LRILTAVAKSRENALLTYTQEESLGRPRAATARSQPPMLCTKPSECDLRQIPDAPV
jgi:hypothetical protein